MIKSPVMHKDKVKTYMTFFPETSKVNITYFMLIRRNNIHIHLFLDNYKPGDLKMSSCANKNCD